VNQPDTFERSMAHWSEAGRAEMEAFYAVATRDYRELALARNWSLWLGARTKILDVACGSGKFPRALARYAGLDDRARTLDLLDPSEFSIDEAARNLEPPFVAGRRYPMRVQDLPPDEGPWEGVWATHALYAVPATELVAALGRFSDAIAPAGVGFIAHARARSFYLAFHRAYLRGHCGGAGTPFSTAEDLLAALESLRVPHEVHDIEYEGRLPASDRKGAEGFLQRCLFDDSVTLETMENDPEMGAVLDVHRDEDGAFRFPQRVAMIFLGR